ncbi:MAG: ribonuclease III [Vampirovibrio sp.]
MMDTQGLSSERIHNIDQLLDILGLSPTQAPMLYHQALTHSSYTYENKFADTDNYERLEFLGDAVLKLCISQLLFQRFPQYREGELTKIRAVVVSDATVAELARTLQLGDYMIFGLSEQRSGGAFKTSSLACAFEALLGALFLDGKMAEINDLLNDLMTDIITDIDLNKTKDNFKAVLQEYSQGEALGLPDYETIQESGPSHNRTFHIVVRLNGEILGQGMGKNKKTAQQEAAKEALIALGVLVIDAL